MAMRGSSLRDKQIASLKKILNLNEEIDSAEHEDTQANGLSNSSPIAWKVLVFDDLGQEYESLLPQSCPGTRVLITGSTVSSALF